VRQVKQPAEVTRSAPGLVLREVPQALTGITPGVRLQTALPRFRSVANRPEQRGRVGIPENSQTKITLYKAPRAVIELRLSPFVQRNWSQPFVWVAVAGVGYLTVPENYYEAFLTFVNTDVPDYDGAVGLLSTAAVREADEGRVRYPMPSGVNYRFIAPAAMAQEANKRASLPLHGQASGDAGRVGRLRIPDNLRPRITLSAIPRADLKVRLGAFVQRDWKRSFVWVAVAGVGYLTVPESHFVTFLAFVGGDEPDYEGVVRLLSIAAVRDDKERRVRHPMPAGVDYRFKATIESAQAAKREGCGLEPFVERVWNRPFVWVLIPETGNVTVPEDVYDRFHTLISSDLPNYRAACELLEEAAAADTIVDASTIAVAPLESCNFEPFIERKWNREFAWVFMPQAGNVTVPEESYDRFHTAVSATPPNYGAACRVLVETAAADMVVIASSAD